MFGKVDLQVSLLSMAANHIDLKVKWASMASRRKFTGIYGVRRWVGMQWGAVWGNSIGAWKLQLNGIKMNVGLFKMRLEDALES